MEVPWPGSNLSCGLCHSCGNARWSLIHCARPGSNLHHHRDIRSLTHCTTVGTLLLQFSIATIINNYRFSGSKQVDLLSYIFVGWKSCWAQLRVSVGPYAFWKLWELICFPCLSHLLEATCICLLMTSFSSFKAAMQHLQISLSDFDTPASL